MTYVKTMLKGRFFWIDLVNMILGLIIIALGFLSLYGDARQIVLITLFGVGSIFMLLNTYKSFRTKSKLKYVFIILTIFFIAIDVLLYMEIS